MWDQPEGGGAASYTVEFSKARVNRKQHKTNDLLVRPPSIDHHEQEALRKQHEDSCMVRLITVSAYNLNSHT